MRKLLETKLYSKNVIKEINAWAVLLVRYLGPLLMWTTEELKQMAQRTRKLMTMHKALRPRNNRQIVCVKKRRKRSHQH